MTDFPIERLYQSNPKIHHSYPSLDIVDRILSHLDTLETKLTGHYVDKDKHPTVLPLLESTQDIRDYIETLMEPTFLLEIFEEGSKQSAYLEIWSFNKKYLNGKVRFYIPKETKTVKFKTPHPQPKK